MFCGAFDEIGSAREIMMASGQEAFMSVEGYFQLERDNGETRYEYIDGYVRMLAGESGKHAIITANTIGTLHHMLRNGPCVIYTSDMRVQLSETRYVYPDISVGCDTRDDPQEHALHYPRLVIEVFSPSTEQYDRSLKFLHYRSCPTIQEYMLIDSQQPLVDLFRRETRNLWTLHTYGLGDEVHLASVAVDVAVAALYEHVMFG